MGRPSASAVRRWPGGVPRTQSVRGQQMFRLRLVASRQIDARKFITHHFAMDEFPEAYDVFARAADTGALKVVLSR